MFYYFSFAKKFAAELYKITEEFEKIQGQEIVRSDSDFDFDQGWQKVKKARRKAKTFEDASFYVYCTSSVGKGLAEHPNNGDASGTISSNKLTGYNLPPKAGGTNEKVQGQEIVSSDSDPEPEHEFIRVEKTYKEGAIKEEQTHIVDTLLIHPYVFTKGSSKKNVTYFMCQGCRKYKKYVPAIFVINKTYYLKAHIIFSHF
mgnify:CR=1 FL=1